MEKAPQGISANDTLNTLSTPSSAAVTSKNSPPDSVVLSLDEAKSEKPSTHSTKKKNRFSYVLTQSAFTFGTYGPALISAFDMEGKAIPATILFSLTGAIAGHSYYAIPRNFEDSHLLGINYGAANSLALSYMLPGLVFGSHTDHGRVGSGLLLAAYPLGVWSGYWYGDQLKLDPGRAGLAPTLAYTGALLMALASPIYLPKSDNGDLSYRIAFSGIIAGGIAGHYGSTQYRRGETLPTGVPLGLVARTLLGLVLGATVLANIDSQDATGEGIFSMLTASTVAGLGEGLWFFQKCEVEYDGRFF
jgi:hypothetical protein